MSSDIKSEVNLKVVSAIKYTCDVCGYRCDSSASLKSHKLVHSGKKLYQCNICLKCFSSKAYLANHCFAHTGEKPYSCDVCQRSFSLPGSLKHHSKMHTAYRRHKCIFCKKGFMFLCELKIHLRLHTNEKPYVCDVCQKAFHLRQSFDSHRHTHSDEKPFSCGVCSRRFWTRSGAQSHVTMRHGPQPAGVMTSERKKPGRKVRPAVKNLPPRQIFPKPGLISATAITLPLPFGVKEMPQATLKMTPQEKMAQWRNVSPADQRSKSRTVFKARKTAAPKTSKGVVQSQKMNLTIAPKTLIAPLTTVPLAPVVMFVTCPLIQAQQVLS